MRRDTALVGGLVLVELFTNQPGRFMERIQRLEGLEYIRRRPGMYIGSVDAYGLHVCVHELVANSIEEHLAGRGTSITVTIHDDGSLSVKDEGGGIPAAVDPKYQKPFIEWVLTTLNVPDNCFKSPYRVARLHGVGTKAANALSEWMRINTVWEGEEYEIKFTRGKTTAPLTKRAGSRMTRGTTVRFKPDPEFFGVTRFDRDGLATALEPLAAIHPGLEFWLIDERPNSANRPLVSFYHYPNGITDYLKLIGPHGCWHSFRQGEPLSWQTEVNGLKIAVGFQFTEWVNVSLLSFVNSAPSRRHGTHVEGFLQGLSAAFTELGRRKKRLRPTEMLGGLNAIVAVWLPEPHYEGATKEELLDPEVKPAVRELTYSGVKQWAAEAGEKARRLAGSFR